MAFHLLVIAVLLPGLDFQKTNEAAFIAFMEKFHQAYGDLQVPGFVFDYKENFANIPGPEQLEKQAAFFDQAEQGLQQFDPKKFSKQNKVHYDHLVYQVKMNRQRLALETRFKKAEQPVIPTNGLSTLDKDWYQYYIQFYTSVAISPDELFALGKKEIEKVKGEIGKIQAELGYANDSAGFYRHINSTALLLSNKDSILNRYEKIKNTAYKNIGRLFEHTSIDNILFMEWPDAGIYTPPGYYSPASDNAFNQGIYYFNFYNGLHNARAMDWLFIHEGVPGHHYQWVMNNKLADQPAFTRNFYYSGNFEGWGAYVEYLGKEIGLYQTPYAYLGKWEWDLVRSVRILIDVGIHHYGWSEAKALACWKKYIPNQDEIAEREVKRCTNWPAQALSYKVGAHRIMQMRDRLKRSLKGFSLKKFHSAFLGMGPVPMEVVENNIALWMK